MSSTAGSLLGAPRERLGPWLLVALALHAAGAGVLLLLASLELGLKRPLIDPQDTIEVSLVAMPKSKRLPDKASRAAAPPPTPEAPPTAAPPPPKVSDLALKTDKPEPVKPTETPQDAKRKVDALMDELRRERLLDDLDAPKGSVDRDATSPDGDEDAPPTTVTGAMRGDPAYARWVGQVSRLFKDQFRPLPLLQGKGLVAKVLVRVDPEGRVTDRRVHSASGNPAWDRAALAATEAVATVPLPPESVRDGGPTELIVIFEDP